MAQYPVYICPNVLYNHKQHSTIIIQQYIAQIILKY